MSENTEWSSHKFQSEKTEGLYEEFVLNSFQDASFGSVDENGAVFDFIDCTDGFFCVVTDSNGFVSLLEFATEVEYNAAVEEVRQGMERYYGIEDPDFM